MLLIERFSNDLIFVFQKIDFWHKLSFPISSLILATFQFFDQVLKFSAKISFSYSKQLRF